MSMMWVVEIKNSSGADHELEDLGITIINGTQIVLSNEFTYTEICNSDSLRTLVDAGSLIVVINSVDQTSSEGVDFLTIDNVHYLNENFYSKLELQAAGSSEVHWENVTNTPSFGSPIWGDPVEYRVTEISSTAPTSPATNDTYIDTNTDHYMEWNGTAWTDEGAVVVGDQVINLSDQWIYTFDGSAYNQSGASADNTAVLVNDDGDGKNAQYIYSTEDTQWYKIGDVDFAQHFNGGASKHDASEIDVEGSYSSIAGTPGDLETAMGGIDTMLTSLSDDVDAISLDYAYDGDAGSGAGRVIDADNGSVKINSNNGTNAPIELVNRTTPPTSDLAAGQLAVVNGVLYVYDATRSKWLSVERQTLVFGRRGKTRNQYLNISAGTLPSINSGFRLLRKATLVGLSYQIDTAGTGDAHIRSNGSTSNDATISLSSAMGNQDTSVNITFNQGDYLQAYSSSAAGVEDPILVVEIAWSL